MAAPQTQENQLLLQIQGQISYRAKMGRLNDFQLKRIEKEADALMKVDAGAGSLIKSAVAGLQWDAPQVDYWVKNAMALDRSTTMLMNCMISYSLINEASKIEEIALRIIDSAPGDHDAVFKAAQKLQMVGLVSKALISMKQLHSNNPKILSAIEHNEDVLMSMRLAGVSEEKYLREVRIAMKVAVDFEVPINAINTVLDKYDGAPCFFVEFICTESSEVIEEIDAALSHRLMEQEDWEPWKFNLGFKAEEAANVL